MRMAKHEIHKGNGAIQRGRRAGQSMMDDAMEYGREAVDGMMETGKSAAGSVLHHGREVVDSALSHGRDMGADIGRIAGRQLVSAGDQVGKMVSRQPLIAVLAAAAIGALIAAVTFR